MNCKNKENIKRLSAIYPRVFRDLHRIVGFDYERPFECYFLEGNFTVNKVLKKLDEVGYTYKDEIILLMRNPRTKYYQDLHLAGIDRGHVRIDYGNTYFSRLKSISNKGLFEEFRKMPHVETFVIVQHMESIKKPEEKEIDKQGRFKSAPIKYKSRIYGCDEYYSIDKSGYIMDEKRQSLHDRAMKLRASRKKEAYLQVDNTGKIKELQTMIDGCKMRIAAEIRAAQTSGEIMTINKKLGYFGLEGIMTSFESYKNTEANRGFKSIEESERAYQRIIEKLGAI